MPRSGPRQIYKYSKEFLVATTHSSHGAVGELADEPKHTVVGELILEHFMVGEIVDGR